MQTRVEPKHQPESPATDADRVEPRLSSDRIDRLLTDTATDLERLDDHEATPMNGVWLAVVVGAIFWALIAGVLLLT